MVKSAPLVGYNDLSPEQVAKANEIKELAKLVSERVEAIFNDEDTDKRWASIARTDLQTGFMALVRSVMKPEFF